LSPSSPSACKCISASLPKEAFFSRLHAALAARTACAESSQLEQIGRATPSMRSVGRKRTTVDGPYLQLALGLMFYRMPNVPRHSVWLEFGVAGGGSTNMTCDVLRHVNDSDVVVHGFDTFSGLPTEWTGTKYGRGAFSQDGVVPHVRPCARLHKGLINTTFPDFIARHAHVSLLGLSVDVDIYEPALLVLLSLRRAGLLKPRRLIHFHEIAQPFGPADYRLGSNDTMRSPQRNLHKGRDHFHYQGPTHPFIKKMNAISARMRAVASPTFFYSDEERALFDFLQATPGARLWLVPLASEGSPESALFVILA